MYRMFQDSYENLIGTLDGVRKEYVQCFRLIYDINIYNQNKRENSTEYKRLNNLLIYITDSMNRFPRLKCFLWELELLGISVDRGNIDESISIEYVDEAAKILNTVMKMNYWY